MKLIPAIVPTQPQTQNRTLSSMDLIYSGVSSVNLFIFVASDGYGDISHPDCAIGVGNTTGTTCRFD